MKLLSAAWAFAGLATVALAQEPVPLVSVTMEPNPPALGAQVFYLDVLDDNGAPWTGQAPTVTLVMPASPGWKESRNAGEVEVIEPGRYRAEVPITLHGEWFLTVGFASDKLADLAYRLKTGELDLTPVDAVPEGKPLPLLRTREAKRSYGTSSSY